MKRFQDFLNESTEENYYATLIEMLCDNEGISYNKAQDLIDDVLVKYDFEINEESLDEIYDTCIFELNNELRESTETKNSEEEKFNDWKLDIFKYLDKRLDMEKSKELKSYIKDFVKNEFGKGQPSWFSVAESILNYARVNHASCIKNNTFSYEIDESVFSMKKLHDCPKRCHPFKEESELAKDINKL